MVSPAAGRDIAKGRVGLALGGCIGYNAGIAQGGRGVCGPSDCYLPEPEVAANG